MKEAELADGTVLEFPDDTDDAVIDAVVAKHMKLASSPSTSGSEQKQEQEPTWAQRLGNWVTEDAAPAVAETAKTVGGAIGDAAAWAGEGIKDAAVKAIKDPGTTLAAALEGASGGLAGAYEKAIGPAPSGWRGALQRFEAEARGNKTLPEAAGEQPLAAIAGALATPAPFGKAKGLGGVAARVGAGSAMGAGSAYARDEDILKGAAFGGGVAGAGEVARGVAKGVQKLRDYAAKKSLEKAVSATHTPAQIQELIESSTLPKSPTKSVVDFPGVRERAEVAQAQITNPKVENAAALAGTVAKARAEAGDVVKGIPKAVGKDYFDTAKFSSEYAAKLQDLQNTPGLKPTATAFKRLGDEIQVWLQTPRSLGEIHNLRQTLDEVAYASEKAAKPGKAAAYREARRLLENEIEAGVKKYAEATGGFASVLPQAYSDAKELYQIHVPMAETTASKASRFGVENVVSPLIGAGLGYVVAPEDYKTVAAIAGAGVGGGAQSLVAALAKKTSWGRAVAGDAIAATQVLKKIGDLRMPEPMARYLAKAIEKGPKALIAAHQFFLDLDPGYKKATEP